MAGRTVLVTGGSGDLGRAIVAKFADEGASVAVIDAHPQADPNLLAAIEGDVSSTASAASAVEDAVEALGGSLDVLVNCAGIADGGLIAEFDEATWEEILRINLTGTFLCMKYAWPHLAEAGGAVVNVASMAGLIALPGLSAYAASKGGVIQLTKVAALEGAAVGIRVNAVCPGWVEGRMTEGYLESLGGSQEARGSLLASMPIGRLAEPREVADAVIYLSSEHASFVTGIALPVDGGMLAT